MCWELSAPPYSRSSRAWAQGYSMAYGRPSQTRQRPSSSKARRGAGSTTKEYPRLRRPVHSRSEECVGGLRGAAEHPEVGIRAYVQEREASPPYISSRGGPLTGCSRRRMLARSSRSCSGTRSTRIGRRSLFAGPRVAAKVALTPLLLAEAVILARLLPGGLPHQQTSP